MKLAKDFDIEATYEFYCYRTIEEHTTKDRSAYLRMANFEATQELVARGHIIAQLDAEHAWNEGNPDMRPDIHIAIEQLIPKLEIRRRVVDEVSVGFLDASSATERAAWAERYRTARRNLAEGLRQLTRLLHLKDGRVDRNEAFLDRIAEELEELRLMNGQLRAALSAIRMGPLNGPIPTLNADDTGAILLTANVTVVVNDQAETDWLNSYPLDAGNAAAWIAQEPIVSANIVEDTPEGLRELEDDLATLAYANFPEQADAIVMDETGDAGLDLEGFFAQAEADTEAFDACLLYTSPSPRD